MTNEKIIAVIGATGQQGGSVVNSLLASGKYKVRALTRNASSDKAKALAARGVEIFEGDMHGAGKLKELLEGAYGVFLVTQFWEKFDAEYEFTGAKTVADEAKAAGVQHFVYSALENVKRLTSEWPSKPTYIVPHFDGKGRAAEYIETLGFPKVSFVQVSFYSENLAGMMAPQKQDDGSFLFVNPMGKTPMHVVALADIGPQVLNVFENAEKYNGKYVGLASDKLTFDEIAALMSKQLGKLVKYQFQPVEVCAKAGYPGAEDLSNMFGFYRDYLTDADRSVEECSKVAKVTSFEEWLKTASIPWAQ
jgi:uncharacterized protein YbjT (DUF2867 family)